MRCLKISLCKTRKSLKGAPIQLDKHKKNNNNENFITYKKFKGFTQ